VVGDDAETSDREQDGTPPAKPDREKVASRAEGRPPEEGSSNDARAQAEAILEDSEDRVAERSARSERDDRA
jgi:hypothetical protein